MFEKCTRNIWWRSGLLLLLMLGIFVLSGRIMPVEAASDDIAEGIECGVPWRITADGKLIIGESGRTYTFNDDGEPLSSQYWRWYGYADQVKKVVFEGTVYGNGDMSEMFMGSAAEEMDLKGFNTSQVTDMSYLFSDCKNLSTLDLSGFDTSQVTSMSYMFDFTDSDDEGEISSLKYIDLSSFDTSQVTSMEWMFKAQKNLQSLDLSNFDTSRVTNMQYMFTDCEHLTSLNVSSFDTSRVKNFEGMFQNCLSLTALDVSGFDTSSATVLSNMFSRCIKLAALDVSGFRTPKAEIMDGMFDGCLCLKTLDVSGLDTSKVTTMNRMFSDLYLITSLDVSGFNTKQVTDLGSMFSGCRSLKTLDLSGFYTPNLTNTWTMFDGCKSLASLDISNMNTRNVQEPHQEKMFGSCTALTSIALGSDTILLVNAPAKGWKRTKLLSGSPANGPSINGFIQYNGSAPGIYTSSAAVASAVKAQPMTVKATTKTLKVSKLKKKALTTSPLNVAKAQGTVTYKKVSGSAKLSINSKTGKVKVKKGTKKGTYKIKVKVTAAGKGVYKKGSKTLTVKIKVK